MKAAPPGIASLPVGMVHARLDSRPDGLDAGEVRERLAHVGPNRYDLPDPWNIPRALLKQFANFFALLLLLSAAICAVAHHANPSQGMNLLGWALAGVALLNAAFSFLQEYRAEKAMEALRAFLPQMVTACRDGRITRISAGDVVPGDVVILSEGDKIPADMRIVESVDLLADHSPLTGESTPCKLVADAMDGEIRDIGNIAFAGCAVLKGSGKGVAFATGIRSEFGKIAQLSQIIKRGSTPLEKETTRMTRTLTIIACSMGFGLFLYGVLTGKPLWMNLVFMMGIIVANVPEGLFPTITLSLAMGSLRMARKNVLVKGLNAVEALGAVHVICTDKTGTLTRNTLTLAECRDPADGGLMEPARRVRLLTLAMAASETRDSPEGFHGDPLDVAVATALAATGAGIPTLMPDVVRHYAFDTARRRSAGILRHDGQDVFVVKGAFEAIRPLLAEAPPALAAAEHVMREMAARGLRVITVAARVLAVGESAAAIAGDPDATALETGLALHGFLGVADPLRPEVPDAVNQCHAAGIHVLMITGDHPDTAMAIARESHIIDDGSGEAYCLTGDDVHRLTVAALAARIRAGVRIFARTNPEQKMKIVTALKSMDLVVAMTGDGVNDAPAMKAADVGIAMGKMGTDVARESAQIILLDDNFASIAAGIAEGRAVYDNIRKFTTYVLASNGPEILPYLLFIILPVPLALGVIHILCIDLGTDMIPAIGLGQEPPDEDAMRKPPRQAAGGLLTRGLLLHAYLFLGLLEGAWSLFLFFSVLTAGGWNYGESLGDDSPLLRSATGLTLSSVVLMQIGNLIGRRHPRLSGLDRGFLANKLMVLGVLLEIAISWAILYFPPVQHFLKTGPVEPRFYLLAWLGIAVVFLADYFRKRLARTRK